MHIPKLFKQEDKAELIKQMKETTFANLISNGTEGVEVNHLPLCVVEEEGKLFLFGHIAKANSLWKKTLDANEVVATFNGPHCYISPNHYPTKKVTGKAVPTWNYIVVHARGKISFIEDKEWILNSIEILTNEQEEGSHSPWKIEDAPRDYTQKLLTAIVGVKIEVTSLEGQWKLSQNQPIENSQGVISALSSSEDPYQREVAQRMKL